RPTAVGWPRVDSVDRTAGAPGASPPLASSHASVDGAEVSPRGADPFQSGRDKTVHEYGRGLDGGRADWSGVSRETDPHTAHPQSSYDPPTTGRTGYTGDDVEQNVPQPRVGNGFVGAQGAGG